MSANEALWLPAPMRRMQVRDAPMPEPGGEEIVVRVRAIAVNPIDRMTGVARRYVTPWLRYPAVLGTDIAGEVVLTGPQVRRFSAGVRVLGYATGQERHRNRAAEGAFQRYVLLQERNCAPIPDRISFEDAAVLPLAMTTAAAGLYETDQLALPAPEKVIAHRNAVVLVWGGSTSVGTNAIQLARASGFEVIATAAVRNHQLLQSLGAAHTFDYRDPEAESRILHVLDGRPLAGTLAIPQGSLTRTLRVVRGATGSKRVASAYPSPGTRLRARMARREGIQVSTIWGGTPTQSAVGVFLYEEFLPAALEDGSYLTAPAAEVVGNGLDAIPHALHLLGKGVSARKLVVTLD